MYSPTADDSQISLLSFSRTCTSIALEDVNQDDNLRSIDEGNLTMSSWNSITETPFRTEASNIFSSNDSMCFSSTFHSLGCTFHWKQCQSGKLISLRVNSDIVWHIMAPYDAETGVGLLEMLTFIDPAELETKAIPYLKRYNYYYTTK